MISILIFIKTLIYQPIFLIVNNFTDNEKIINESLYIDMLLTYLIPLVLYSFTYKVTNKKINLIRKFFLIRIIFLLPLLLLKLYFTPELIPSFLSNLHYGLFQWIIIFPLFIIYYYFLGVYDFAILNRLDHILDESLELKTIIIIIFIESLLSVLGALKIISKNNKYKKVSNLPLLLFLIRCFGVVIIGLVFIVMTISGLGNELGLLTRAGAQIGECGL